MFYSYLKPSRTTLVPKNLGPGLPHKNFRPITIASCILHLYTKTFVNRLNAYELLCGAQRGFVRRTGFFENTYTVRALIKAAKEEKRSIDIVTIDLAKAFNSVQQSCVQRTLHRFGPSEHLRRIADDFYLGVETQLNVGWQQLGHIIMRNGVKQGDPFESVSVQLGY